jgi:serine/threonine protein kinase
MANSQQPPDFRTLASPVFAASTARGADTPGAADAAIYKAILAPPQQPDEVGRLGGYRVLKLLGQGGMGLVFLAEDERLQRTVALKVMLPKFAADENARLRFLREARLAAGITSDHIITLYQVGEERGIPFIAMELLKGRSLEDWLAKGKPVTMRQIARIGRDVAKGLAAAHAKGLVHRDIKPANLWLEAPNGRVKILDFGLARQAHDEVTLTRTGAIVGTPAYMAPEQANGDETDARTDLYSLGCVLFHLCTGRLPIQGEGVLPLLAALATTTAPPVRSINPQVPEALANLVDQLLARNPAERPESAQKVMTALSAIEAELGRGPATGSMAVNIGGESVSLRQVVLPTPRPWPYLPSALVAGALVALIGSMGGWWLFSGTPPAQVAPTQLAVSDRPPPDAPPKDNLRSTDPLALPSLPKREPNAVKTVALWVQSVGGRVTVRRDANDQTLGPQASLPEEPWALIGVDLSNCSVVGDGDSGRLRDAPEVEELSLLRTGITDEGLRHLAGCRRLKKVRLDGLPVTAHGLRALADLPIVQLGLAGTRITPQALPIILGFGDLESLDLTGCPFADADLAQLAELRKLRKLIVTGTKATDAGVEQLATQLPACTIGWQGRWLPPRGTSAKSMTPAETPPSPPPPTVAPPRTALRFDGTRTYVDIPKLPWPGDQAFTIEAYVVPRGERRPVPLIQWRANDDLIALIAFAEGMGTSGTATRDWAGILHRNQQERSVVSLGSLNAGKRSHIAFVWTGTGGGIFIDGQMVNNAQFAWTSSGFAFGFDAGGRPVGKPMRKPERKVPAEPLLRIGAGGLEGQRKVGPFFQGELAELRISKVARYTEAFTPAARFDSDADTLGLYHADEGQGDILKDSSGHNRHGKIMHGQWVKLPAEPGGK